MIKHLLTLTIKFKKSLVALGAVIIFLLTISGYFYSNIVLPGRAMFNQFTADFAVLRLTAVETNDLCLNAQQNPDRYSAEEFFASLQNIQDKKLKALEKASQLEYEYEFLKKDQAEKVKAYMVWNWSQYLDIEKNKSCPSQPMESQKIMDWEESIEKTFPETFWDFIIYYFT